MNHRKNWEKLFQRLKRIGFNLFFIMLSITCLTTIGFAQDNNSTTNLSPNGTNVGTTAAAFLEIGVGARAQAMGGAYVSFANDATAMYWNPAGIGRISKFETAFSHVSWLLDTNFDYFGIVSPVNNKIVVGLNVTVFGTDDQPVRVVGLEEGTGEFYSLQDLSASLSFALNLTDRFSLGLNAKYINQRIWHSSATGFALDVGGLYKTQYDGLQIGYSISNFGTEMQLAGRDLINAIDPDIINEGVENVPVNYETGSFGLPMLFRFGISYDKPLDFLESNLLLAVDLLKPNNYEESLNIGAEYLVLDKYALRAGYQSPFMSEHQGGLSIGGGIVIPSRQSYQFVIDYAFVDWGILNSVHIYSISIRF